VPRILPLALAGALLLGCTGPSGVPAMLEIAPPEPEIFRGPEGPPDAAPDSCWSRDVTPAVVETVTDQIMLQPAEIASDGRVLAPAVFKTETRQQILREREEVWFQTPCPEERTPEFIASVQRALAARGVYRGPVTGTEDAATRRAIRRFQAEQGLDSAVLSIAAARQLGLIAVDPATLGIEAEEPPA